MNFIQILRSESFHFINSNTTYKWIISKQEGEQAHRDRHWYVGYHFVRRNFQAFTYAYFLSLHPRRQAISILIGIHFFDKFNIKINKIEISTEENKSNNQLSAHYLDKWPIYFILKY